MPKTKRENQIPKYNPQEIEPKWQKKWEETGLYRALDFDKRPKFYVLIEFPYPSGAGLHVGHVRSWSAMDAYSRKKRMEGKNVLYPIGWDAFGLPAENYALKMHVHPSTIVPQNIARFKKQCKSLGLSFDWSREINTTDPEYYKWTQWIFLKFFEKGLAYRADVPVNWCPACKTNLADEEVLPDGTHERCGNLTEKRMQKQWLLRITAYADRLIEDLKLVDYSQKIAVQQVNWIGRSEGAELEFKIKNSELKIKVFTTRPDTLYGATFMVLAPENPISTEIAKKNKKAAEYIKRAQNKTEQEKIAEGKDKTGVDTGLTAINPVNNEEIPIWIADYVVMGYGTEAIMAVPAHDKRDFEFAKKYNLPIKPVILGSQGSEKELAEAFVGDGKIINSEDWNGFKVPQDIKKVIGWLEKKGLGKREIHYHLRDWVFSRQHYWGEPIPVVYCANCAIDKISNIKYQISNIKGTDYAIVPVPEDQLPVELPYLEKYEPSGTGESPLANAKDWVNTQCPACKGPARRETDTMPNWAGSNWYYLAYLFADKLGNQKSKIKNQKSKERVRSNVFEENQDLARYWMPVDIYQGGFEHTTLHLLYSRFVYKFLYDIGVVPGKEPYKKRRSHGVVLGPDGRKMSKSFGNIINPDDIVNKFGADTLRIYEMFMGPFDQTIAWSEESVEGCFRFLKRVWQLSLTKVSDKNTSVKLVYKLHKTIKKVSEDLENMKFNTAVASMMELINSWKSDQGGLNKDDFRKFLLILAPFAPHMTEELWKNFSKNKSIHKEPWPKFDTAAIVEEEVTIVVQINGKIRDTLRASMEESGNQQLIENIAKKSQKIEKYLNSRKIKKAVYVKGRVINFVVV
ncbi:MAG: leucine--tRNA ligase [Patescibacteria group bacterium]